MKLGSIPVPSKISLTWSRTPHSGGGWKPSGGGGAVLGDRREELPDRTGRVPRCDPHPAARLQHPGDLAAARLWVGGEDMQPKVETTTSKLWSSNGIS